MQISYQERIGKDGEPRAVPVLPAGASLHQIEAVLVEEGAAVLSEEQHARLEYHFRQGVTSDGVAL